ncbi:MAG: RluA family pseudouridine synthase [Aquabacterium sp.]|uniref:RluA family pseudouridine synthase n=1 Tax=Aquabacterium sp. TaxID=1872578 RepID=UPI003BEEA41D
MSHINTQQIHNVAKTIIGAKNTARTTVQTTKKPAAAQTEVLASVQRLTIDEGSAGQRLDNYLIKILKGAPKTLVYRIIRSGEVRVNKGRAAADTRLELGDEVRVPPLRLAEKDEQREAAVPAREFPVLFEDDHMLAINKPAGVAVHGGSGVSFGVIEQLRRARPQAKFLELVHRLDKETSGILLIAKKRSALTSLQDFFRHRQAHKTYAALVIGDWPAARKVIDVALHKYLTPEGERRVKAVKDDDDDGRRSISLVHVVQRFANFSLLDVTIKTGRTHQIRVHLQNEGHPIVGDDKYGDFALNKALARGGSDDLPGVMRSQLKDGRFERMFLHARYLRLPHPVSGEELTLQAPLPAECENLLSALRPLAQP